MTLSKENLRSTNEVHKYYDFITNKNPYNPNRMF